MTVRRVKTTMSKVQKAISPYVHKHVFGRDTVDANDIEQIAVLLPGQYKTFRFLRDWID